MSPKVLQLFEPAAGGVAEHVRLLAEGLAQRGFAVEVAGPAGAAPRARLEAAGIPFRPLPMVPDMVLLRADVPATRQLWSILRRERFDILHTHSLKAGLVGRLAGPAARVPTLYTPHCLDYRTDFYDGWPGVRSRRLKALSMERALGLVTAGFVAVSEDERQGALDDHLVPETRTHTILNGVEPALATAPDPGLMAFRGEGPLLGFVSGLRIQKGLPTLLEALELLHERGTPVRFAIVGDGELWDEVRGRIDAGPLRDTTLLAPFSGPMSSYLHALDGFVLASYWEALPLAVLEAMHAGLPVVATSVGGTPEAVQDGRTGMLVPRADAVALADRLHLLATDAELRHRMGQAGLRLARERFGVERMVEQTAELYRTCLGHPRP